MRRLEVSGSHRERGNQHGEEFRKEILELIRIRRGLTQGYLGDQHAMELERLSFGLVEKLQQYTRFFEEFCGIAEAANVSLVDLMILNNYTDMRDFFVPHEEDPEDGGCSTVGLKNQHGVICGQTWDMHASAAPYMVQMKVKDDIGTSEVLTLTGCMGLAGLNDRRVGIFINNMHCSETSMGLMWAALVRGVLMHQTASEGFSYIEQNFPASGHNYLICDPKEIINVETTGRRVIPSYRSKDSGVTFHTNHYVGELKEVEIVSRQSATTHKRYEEIQQYFEGQDLDSINVDMIRDDILAGGKTPSVDVPPPEKEHASATCGGILADLASGECLSWTKNYSAGDQLKYTV